MLAPTPRDDLDPHDEVESLLKAAADVLFRHARQTMPPDAARLAAIDQLQIDLEWFAEERGFVLDPEWIEPWQEVHYVRKAQPDEHHH